MMISPEQFTELIHRAECAWPDLDRQHLPVLPVRLQELVRMISQQVGVSPTDIQSTLDEWLNRTEDPSYRVATAPADPLAQSSDQSIGHSRRD